MNKNNSQIIWKDQNGKKKPFTIIYESKNHKKSYRYWNPITSKLGAALSNGLEIFPFFSNSKVFYSGNSSDSTIDHLSDIIDQHNGLINIQDQKNSITIQKEKFDIVYLDIDDLKKLQSQINDSKKIQLFII